MTRTVGVPGAVLLGLGSMLGTGAFVGVALAAEVAGPAVVPATLLAAALALCNAFSSAQLAAAHPVSGGTYEYGHRLLGCRGWPGFAAGWLFLGAKGASAATAAVGLTGYLFALAPHADDSSSPWPTGPCAAGLVLAVTAFVAGGLRRSNRGNAVLVGVAVAGLLAFLFAASAGSYKSEQRVLWEPAGASAAGRARELAAAAALMFVAFAGYGRLATLGEEVRDPARNIPRAILVTLGVTAVLYVAVAAAVAAFAPHVPAELLREPNPLAALAGRARGAGPLPAVVTAGAVAAVGGSLLNLLLGLSRVLLAMARRGEMPGWFARLSGTAANDSPRRAVWAVGLGVAVAAGFGSVKLAWSVSACAVLLYYGLTNAAALRLPADSRRYPRAFAWAGLAGCAGLAWFVTPAAATIVGAWLIAGAAWRIVRHVLNGTATVREPAPARCDRGEPAP